MSAIENRCVTLDQTVEAALAGINACGGSVVLLVDNEGKLVRTVSDGDLRRFLLAGFKLTSTLDALPPATPVAADKSTSPAELRALMEFHAISTIPLLDVGGRPVAIVDADRRPGRIYLSAPDMGGEEKFFVNEAFETNWIAPLGPNVDLFERQLASVAGVPAVAALSSGTAAIHLALIQAGVGAGDVVLCSSFTFVASANPILYQGAVPVFVDSDDKSWNMCPIALERALEAQKRDGRPAKAIIVVNLYGQSADFDPIQELAGAYGAVVIEDAAESLGATYKGRASGSLGRFGVYSFNGNKIITTSGGGALLGHEEELIDDARVLGAQAREPALHYEHTRVGYNYRMSNVLAGIGLGQLQVLEDRIARRRHIFDLYRERLDGISGVSWMPEADYGRSTRWLSAMTLDPTRWSDGRDLVVKKLMDVDVEVRPVWKPMHQQPLFRGAAFFTAANRDVDAISSRLFETSVCLPSGSNLSDEDVVRVADEIRKCLYQ